MTTARRNRTVWTPARVFRVMTLIEHGRSDQQIADRLGTSPYMIRWLRRRHDIAPVTRTNHTCRSVGEILGVDEKTVAAWLRRGWLSGRRLQLRRGRSRQWRVTELDLYAFLDDRAHWHRWEPARITDRDLREWAETMRSGIRFLTLTEAARIAFVQPKTVAGWIRDKRLPAYRNGNHLVAEHELRAFLATRQMETTQP